jgi:hypothetical protein
MVSEAVVGVASGVGGMVAVAGAVDEGEGTAVFVAVATDTRVIAIVACTAASGVQPATTIAKPITNKIFSFIWYMLTPENSVNSSMQAVALTGNENNGRSLYGSDVCPLR